MCAGICTCAQVYVSCKCAQECACEVVHVCIRQLHLCGHVWIIHVHRNTYVCLWVVDKYRSVCVEVYMHVGYMYVSSMM